MFGWKRRAQEALELLQKFSNDLDVAVDEIVLLRAVADAAADLCEHLARIPYRDSAQYRVTNSPFYENAVNALALAQAGEAGTAETVLTGSVHEHATPPGDAP